MRLFKLRVFERALNFSKKTEKNGFFLERESGGETVLELRAAWIEGG